MKIVETLVSMSDGPRRVGVVRGDDGQCWLTASLERVDGQPLEGFGPVMLPLVEGRSLHGGLVPPGAVSAEVLDDARSRHRAQVGGGAWVAVLDEPSGWEPAYVCFRDDAGDPVAPPLPATWERSPVPDAVEPCPACEVVAWDEVRPDDDSRGMADAEFGAVVCRRCGHEESIPTFFGPGADPPTDPIPSSARPSFMQRARGVLRGLSFVVYALEGVPGRVHGWGARNGATTRITVRHEVAGATIEVETAHEAPVFHDEQALARRALERILPDPGPWPRRSRAGLAIWMNTRDRERRRIAAQSPVTRQVGFLDGEPAWFSLCSDERCWAAVRVEGDLTLTVTSTNADRDSFRLRTVADPGVELEVG